MKAADFLTGLHHLNSLGIEEKVAKLGANQVAEDILQYIQEAYHIGLESSKGATWRQRKCKQIKADLCHDNPEGNKTSANNTVVLSDSDFPQPVQPSHQIQDHMGIQPTVSFTPVNGMSPYSN